MRRRVDGARHQVDAVLGDRSNCLPRRLDQKGGDNAAKLNIKSRMEFKARITDWWKISLNTDVSAVERSEDSRESLAAMD